jgi:hypothetical protein
MVSDQYQELRQLIRGRAGDAFRGAVKYDQHDWTMLYARDDVVTTCWPGGRPRIAPAGRKH